MLAAAACHEDEPNAPEPAAQQFRSRPDLRPPPVEIAEQSRGAAPGYVFLAPKREVAQAGPLILDDEGEVVWFRPLDTHGVTDFRVQRYDGRPVLTWWRGQSERGIGDGHFVILDDAYREIATVSAGNGLTGDIHEFLITDRDTALILVYHRVPRDLRPLGGPARGEIWDNIVQELDIATGRVLFEWHSLDHVAPAESYAPVPDPEKGEEADAYDYFHVNSVDVDDDGDLIVSARNTHAVYKLDRDTGEVIWRLGGKESDYALGPGVRFAWQHDARRQPDDTLTLFDNVAAEEDEGGASRVIVLRLDDEPRRATLERSYRHPTGLLSTTQGNAQFLPGGHVFVGWGSQRWFTEFDSDGDVAFDGSFGSEGADSYRAYRFRWVGRPVEAPAVAVEPGEGDERWVVHVSWNGATEVARWQVLAGAEARRLQPLAERARTGFETVVPVATDAAMLQVRALNARGAVLGTSRPVDLGELD
ncbi:MAG TPA: arylsulfotransferase family protein [Gaiellaceae bacterium]|nr:arylsulfotransferase family protein [Gaiellaceae bacterium]